MVLKPAARVLVRLHGNGYFAEVLYAVDLIQLVVEFAIYGQGLLEFLAALSNSLLVCESLARFEIHRASLLLNPISL